MKIMLIDKQQEITLIKEAIITAADDPEITYITSLYNAQEEILRTAPDIILIGSGIILMEGLELVRSLNEIPIVIITETERFLHLITDPPENIYSILRAFDLDEIPLMLHKAVELCSIHKEKLKCT